MTEEFSALFVRAQGGDAQAFSDLAAANWPRLYRICLRFLQDPGRAEDLAQEALTRAWLRLGQLRQGDAFTPWLLQTAANLAKNELRRRREEPQPPEAFDRTADGEDAAAGMVRGEQRQRIDAALASLPAMQRVAIELVLRDELGYRAAAGILGVPLGTLKTLVHRGRARLQAALAGDATPRAGGAVHARVDV